MNKKLFLLALLTSGAMIQGAAEENGDQKDLVLLYDMMFNVKFEGTPVGCVHAPGGSTYKELFDSIKKLSKVHPCRIVHAGRHVETPAMLSDCLHAGSTDVHVVRERQHE